MKRAVSLILMIAGLVLVLAAGVTLLGERMATAPSELALPGSIADLPQTSVIHGQQAIDGISRMHARSFPLTSAATAAYGSADQIMIWVAALEDTGAASEMVIQMREAIAEGSSPFTPMGEWTEAGKTIYQLAGMGQEHFYFLSGRYVIWLAADADLSDRALEEVLQFYR